ncbi:von Hippel-Lindau disease tumor suppressor protein [Prosthecobacter fusiformis]|uniref:von Hippel-Lindau disease tumor suppressor protein n=1 Tax=Prosthecobacter fusiformis TaxID=48464 RepID=A0A4R7SP07_9BACT|nr:hypothetical protein [Prosthecobacter fusiformis]TDU80711.1 von Hippel-Lindau disease tumor suppressor protein [Prosthecobacter fusiformis]
MKLSILGLSISLVLTTCLPLMAAPAHPAEGKGIRSENGDIESLITFHNRSSESVKIYWLDYAGKRVLYKTLQSQEALAQITFLTHPWLITDTDGNAWHLYYADAQPRIIEIIAPAVR